MLNLHFRNTILAIFLCLASYQSAFATHIIGGEMNYKCLGNEQYEVSLTVYRDCFLGEALLDDTAYVAIYTTEGTLFRTLPILFDKSDTISQVDACLFIPPNICVETTTYIDTIQLPFRVGGYHLSYQRCCRNATILNIIDPLNTGATYDIILTEEAMQLCNSSPVLSDWPPTFICVNRPIQYNHSATDRDGDSLVYSLCTPFVGGISIDNPRPRPAFPPPYDTVVWKTPYNLENLLGGNPLKINPQTGFLTGQPNVLGQYVVGICIREYRNGQLLSTTRRDFQYNVIPCEDVVAQFEMPQGQCDEFTVEIDNQTGGEPEGFLWEFLDRESNLVDTSTLQDPIYTFPDTGLYIVRLTVNPEDVCISTIEKSIYIQKNSVIADFQYDLLSCADSLVLQFNDLSMDNIGTITNWSWTFDGTIDQFLSQEQSPRITIMNSQQLTVTLEVTSENGCTGEQSIDLNAMIIPDSFSVSRFDTLIVCKGDSVKLNPIFNPDLIYTWSPPDGLSDIHSPNPSAFPETSTDYLVSIQDSSENCELRKSVFLEVIDFDNIFNFTSNLLNCSDSLQLQIIPDNNFVLGNRTLLWEVINAGDTSYYSNLNPVIIIHNSEPIQINGILSDAFGCSITKTENLQFELISDEIEDSISICEGESVELNPDFNPNLIYTWFPTTGLSDANSPNPTASPSVSTIYSVSIRDSSGICEVNKNVAVEIVKFDPNFDFTTTILECTDRLLLRINLDDNFVLGNRNLRWEVINVGDTTFYNNVTPDLEFFNSDSIQIIGTVFNEFGCIISREEMLQVELITEEIPSKITICSGDSVELNPDFNPDYIYSWEPAELFPDPTSPNPKIVVNSFRIVTVVISNAAGTCSTRKNTEIDVLNSVAFADFQFKVNGCTDSLELEITDISTTPLVFGADYFWELTGENESMTSEERTPTFILKNSQAINLTLSINKDDPCPFSTTKSFRVNLLENINLPDSVTICNGESIDLNPIPSFPDYTYDWTPAASLVNANTLNPTASPSQTTTYQLTYTDSTGLCQIQKNTTVEVLDTLEKLAADFTVSCDARTVDFRSNNSGEINWDFGDGSPIFQSDGTSNVQNIYENSGSFEVKLTYDNRNICPDSVNLVVDLPIGNLTPNFDWNVEACNDNIATLELLDLSKASFGEITSWEWTLSNGLTSTTQEPAFQIANAEALTATLKVTLDNNENCVDSFQLLLPELIIEEMVPDSIFACFDKIVSLNPDFNDSYQYEWTPTLGLSDANAPNPIIRIKGAVDYMVTISNEFDCFIMDTVLTSVAPEIVITSLEIPTICEPMEVVLLAESEQAVHQWWLNENGDTLSFEPELLVNIDEPKSFTVGLMDEFGCPIDSTFFINYQPIELEYATDQRFCSIDNPQIRITNLRPENELKFDWQPTEDILSGGDTDSPIVQAEEPTIFTFTAGNEFDCKVTGDVLVEIKAPVTPEVFAMPDTIFNGDPVQLMSTQNPTYTYNWSPANTLNNSAIFNPIAMPSETTTYTVTVQDELGCSGSASVNVFVRPAICSEPFIFIPTGFTPNGDGENDILFVRGNFITEMTFIIYDRWGDKTFETTNQDVGWDGTRNGKELPSGVFGYYLKAVCENGEVFTKQGNITLIR